MKKAFTGLIIAAIFGGVASAQAPVSTPGGGVLVMPKRASVAVVGAGGKTIGQAMLSEAPDGVMIRIELAPGALSEGWHGIHLHEKADCADAAFKTAGGHVGHGQNGKLHGLMNPMGPEPGDLPNLYAPAKGAISAEFFSTLVTLSSTPMGGRAPLLDADGSALVIHAKTDDQTSQPIGGAGDRVACAAIRG
jgi:Cu-Zn family superoxide dismutase